MNNIVNVIIHSPYIQEFADIIASSFEMQYNAPIDNEELIHALDDKLFGEDFHGLLDWIEVTSPDISELKDFFLPTSLEVSSDINERMELLKTLIHSSMTKMNNGYRLIGAKVLNPDGLLYLRYLKEGNENRV